MHTYEKLALPAPLKPFRTSRWSIQAFGYVSGLLDCVESETISYRLIIAPETRLAIVSSTFPLRAPPPFVVNLIERLP